MRKLSTVNDLVLKLRDTRDLSDAELRAMLETDAFDAQLIAAADNVRRASYGTDVYVRGLIEFTNYCRNNCYYCGIRAGNAQAARYRLTKAQILDCCREGYRLGFRTFVLQGGEDMTYTDADICDIVAAIREAHADCAITLSIGERSYESYLAYYQAGANRFLLRHETASDAHYAMLHPPELSLAHRKKCLYDLKSIGYQIGAGFMVGSPYQTTAHIIEDLRFLQDLQPDMIGIGPYIPHRQTPFGDMPGGSLELTVRLIAVLRLMFPYALLPATTALGTIHPLGREMGLKAGANVIMPNLSPVGVRKKYELYENKICTGEEAAECRHCLDRRVEAAGYRIVIDRGDVKK
ncbi:MAG: [Clostridia bacterium]|nr:[FeFe] hydrogenase H-cluster radical SAM maturase HydE [Clostridia bacterium]